jgi:hypothetical protein
MRSFRSRAGCSTLALPLVFLFGVWSVRADELPIVSDVALQPLAAQVRRVDEALDSLGQPLSDETKARIDSALRGIATTSSVITALALQEALDPYCLAGVQIDRERRVTAAPGPARPELVQQGWRVFLVKVQNEARVTAPLAAASPNALPVYQRATGSPEPRKSVPEAAIPERWAEVQMYDDRPMTAALSGLPVEYRIIQIYSREAGQHPGKLSFHVGQGSRGAGGDVDVVFQCQPAVVVALDVRDEDGRPAMGSLLFRDAQKRVYPAQSRRLAPDLFFHPQIYRSAGETVLLPPGTYSVEYTRGPEYLTLHRTITVPKAKTHRESFTLRRWAHLARLGWFSGDHHVHAAGCAHYESPTEGVKPDDMMRHILGEDLDVGCVLSWGPCWYAQKVYFDGKLHPLSTPESLMRYDVEVSGFPSSHAGHLCLLRLQEDDYPGTSRIEEWPSWDLPILQWGRSQGGVVGFSHSGWGLVTRDNALPSDDVPPFNSIGANEYIVDVVHGAVDFISTVDTPAPWELNIWYHTLNCGYRTRISGETDFPCIYGQRVGMGRSYVKLDDGKLDFDRFIEGIKLGRSYVSDGKSHLVDFAVNGLGIGQDGSELKLDSPGSIEVTARVAARLEPELTLELDALRNLPLSTKPYWELERARIGSTREVPVELVVNGLPVARREIEADGAFRDLKFSVPIKSSSWVALRVYPSSHTNPIFVVVAGKPIRASRKSAEWCLKSVDQCWSQKSPRYRESERAEASKAYDAARAAYRKILAESPQD